MRLCVRPAAFPPDSPGVWREYPGVFGGSSESVGLSQLLHLTAAASRLFEVQRLSSRRGKILGMDSSDGFSIVKATVPQKELYQYSTVIRSLTGGRGIHSEELSHYEEMPKEFEAKIIAEAKKAREEAHAAHAHS